MAQLKDIARESGVSVRTVGRALRRSGYVSAAVRRRVEEAAERLGYRPDLTARALRTGQRFDVTVLVNELNELIMARLEALEGRLRAEGYAVQVLFARGTDGPAPLTARMTERLLERRPAGVAFMGSLPLDVPRVAAALDAAGVPCVGVDARVPGVEDVGIGREEGVEAAVRYLAAAGRRRVAYLGPAGDRTRLDGYERAMAALGRPPCVVAAEQMTPDAAERLLALSPRPDAVQVHSDRWAMILLRELAARGVAVPADMAVVGFDDRELAAFARPALTTLAQPGREVGEGAAEVLLARMRGGEGPGRGGGRRVPMRLVQRESA